MDPMPEPARWTCRPYDVSAAHRLAADLGVSATVAAILARRGHADPAAARAFLAAEERHDPFAFPDMRVVCGRILEHLERGSRIVVHGDYDVDGVCSTAIVVRALRALGGDPRWHLPSRFDEGYGLSRATIDRLAADGTDLLITVDCAITSADEIDQALARGIDVIVTDHHRPAERLPACPLLHPALGGYPFPDLCAAGVAHKLAQALHVMACAQPGTADDDLDLVALATICDVVPLRGENRRLAREGLRALARTTKPGLRALMRIAQVDPGRMSAHAVGFRLGPRLNAAGRLQRADAALELVLTEDDERAVAVADELDLLNRERRDTETRIAFAAEAALAEQAGAAAYVLAGEGWHPGVIGIVAARMVERHHRPCVMVALDGSTGTGSGRSIPAFDLHAGFAACSGHLRRFGGHRAAAGLEIDTAELGPFRAAFAEHAASVLTPEDLMRRVIADAVVPGDSLGLPLAEELERLAPFGQGNPAPVLVVPAARVSDVRGMGDEDQHTRFTVTSGGSRARAAAFRTPPKSLETLGDDPHDLVVCLEVGEWNGAVEPRVVMRAACAVEPGTAVVLGDTDNGNGDGNGGGGNGNGGNEGGPGDYLARFERRLAADLERVSSFGGYGNHNWTPTARAEVVDRRGEGIAGVAGDLLSSGERVLAVCADVPRRRGSLERLIGGVAAHVQASGRAAQAEGQAAQPPPGAALALVEWDALAADPSLADGFPHLLAVDPPAGAAAEAALTHARVRLAHKAWGLPEVDFALAVARSRLDVRAPLAELYRRLRDEPPSNPEALERALRGPGEHPRPPALAARLVRVLGELGLVRYEASTRTCVVLDAQRASLERSLTYRAAKEALAEAERLLERERAALRGPRETQEARLTL
jgi:single-stranded-DNA-specific exonuclease